LPCGVIEAESSVASDFFGASSSALREIALGQRSQTSDDAFEDPGAVAGNPCGQCASFLHQARGHKRQKREIIVRREAAAEGRTIAEKVGVFPENLAYCKGSLV
jgi:hypothetical protein